MDLSIPSWFKYRQGEAKPAGDHCYLLTAPLVDPTHIKVRSVNGHWQAAVSVAPDGPDEAVTEPKFANEVDAWSAAFELYRTLRIC